MFWESDGDLAASPSRHAALNLLLSFFTTGAAQRTIRLEVYWDSVRRVELTYICWFLANLVAFPFPVYLQISLDPSTNFLHASLQESCRLQRASYDNLLSDNHLNAFVMSRSGGGPRLPGRHSLTLLE